MTQLPAAQLMEKAELLNLAQPACSMRRKQPGPGPGDQSHF
jgi:hypothetical protein